MQQRNDAKFEKLSNQVGAIGDREFQQLIDDGYGIPNAIAIADMRLAKYRDGEQLGDGRQLNDSMFAWLARAPRNFIGALADRWHSFWGS